MLLAVQRLLLGRMRKPVVSRGVPIGVFAINWVACRSVPRSKRGSIIPGAISPRKEGVEFRLPPLRSPSISSCAPTRSPIDGASRQCRHKSVSFRPRVIPTTWPISRGWLWPSARRRTSPPDSQAVGYPLTVVRSLIARPGRRVLSRSAEPKRGSGMGAALTRWISWKAA